MPSSPELRIDFLGISLAYDERVLTPRLETESLVLGTVARLRNKVVPSDIVDVGTGSGALILALGPRFPTARLHAIDLSPDALTVARYNAETQGTDVSFSEGSLLDGFLESAPFEDRDLLVIANLPYIAEHEEIGEDVRVEDPAMALYGGGADGFDLVRMLMEQGLELASQCRSLHMSLEFGHTQLPLVLAWAQENRISVESWNDYSGIPRFALLEYGHR